MYKYVYIPIYKGTLLDQAGLAWPTPPRPRVAALTVCVRLVESRRNVAGGEPFARGPAARPAAACPPPSAACPCKCSIPMAPHPPTAPTPVPLHRSPGQSPKCARPSDASRLRVAHDMWAGGGDVASRDDAVRERRRVAPCGAKGVSGVSPLVRSMPGGGTSVPDLAPVSRAELVVACTVPSPLLPV